MIQRCSKRPTPCLSDPYIENGINFHNMNVLQGVELNQVLLIWFQNDLTDNHEFYQPLWNPGSVTIRVRFNIFHIPNTSRLRKNWKLRRILTQNGHFRKYERHFAVLISIRYLGDHLECPRWLYVCERNVWHELWSVWCHQDDIQTVRTVFRRSKSCKSMWSKLRSRKLKTLKIRVFRIFIAWSALRWCWWIHCPIYSKSEPRYKYFVSYKTEIDMNLINFLDFYRCNRKKLGQNFVLWSFQQVH